MSNIMKYKGYEGTTEIDMTRGVCRGRILFVTDLVTYESETPKGLEAEFRAAVDDYLATCEELGRPAQKPLCGQFNVRTQPDIHKEAKRRAVQDGTSLNDVVVRALTCYLKTAPEVTNNHYLVVGAEQFEGGKMFVTALTENTPYGVTASVKTH